MTQLWTILSAGEVLCPAFETQSAGSHPKDNGWPWATGQAATRIDQAPDPASDEWSGTAWVRSLTVAKQRARDAIKARRDVAQDGGCATPLGRVDTDADSRGKISGAVQMAMIAQAAGAPFALGWTMADNSTVEHDGPAMIAMGLAVGQHVAGCHAAGLVKLQAVDAAADVGAVDAVDLDEGWPGA